VPKRGTLTARHPPQRLSEVFSSRFGSLRRAEAKFDSRPAPTPPYCCPYPYPYCILRAHARLDGAAPT